MGDGNHPVCFGPRFLHQFASRGFVGRLPGLDVPSRELPTRVAPHSDDHQLLAGDGHDQDAEGQRASRQLRIGHELDAHLEPAVMGDDEPVRVGAAHFQLRPVGVEARTHAPRRSHSRRASRFSSTFQKATANRRILSGSSSM